jgi:hypothetical protein
MARKAALVLCVLVATALVGCKKEDAGGAPAPAAVAGEPPATDAHQKVSELERTSTRKIIKNAELGLTVSSVPNAQRDASKIAERHGGFVLSSEAEGSDASQPRVRVVFKVKADELDKALDELRAMGTRRGSDRVTSQDVTDEWIDVDARLKTQKALEARYLEVLKDASVVKDLLDTEKQLAEVRTEIEKLEGRKRFLDSQVALSTVTVSFVEEAPLVTASSSAFGKAIKSAGGDLVNVSAALIVGIIRLLGFLVPVALIVLLPGFLLGRMALRRVARM